MTDEHSIYTATMVYLSVHPPTYSQQILVDFRRMLHSAVYDPVEVRLLWKNVRFLAMGVL
jgi:hypothetical protein